MTPSKRTICSTNGIIVKGKSPKVIAGKTEVIEDIHTGRAKFKGSEEAQADN